MKNQLSTAGLFERFDLTNFEDFEKFNKEWDEAEGSGNFEMWLKAKVAEGDAKREESGG